MAPDCSDDNDYRDSLGRLERKTSEHVTVNKHETLYRSIEERLADAEDGN
ncbi:unnamed protein product [Anisakis simplex]|uniref:Addiction module toxin RelE n=1 Tax=Anisakis simplex TaxID=6269 RepID=A0A0M3KH57_ANISI|nr:unnamed protein product [Anisakis simplex]